jgi:hypothetical protein
MPTPERSARPQTESATPSQTAAPGRDPKSESARSGVNTTYSPVMNPVLDTDVRSRPAVWSA